MKGKVISSYGPHEIEVSVVYPGEDSSRHQDVCLETQEGHLGWRKEIWKSSAGHQRHGSTRDPVMCISAWEAKLAWDGPPEGTVSGGVAGEQLSKVKTTTECRGVKQKEKRLMLCVRCCWKLMAAPGSHLPALADEMVGDLVTAVILEKVIYVIGIVNSLGLSDQAESQVFPFWYSLVV